MDEYVKKNIKKTVSVIIKLTIIGIILGFLAKLGEPQEKSIFWNGFAIPFFIYIVYWFIRLIIMVFKMLIKK